MSIFKSIDFMLARHADEFLLPGNKRVDVSVKHSFCFVIFKNHIDAIWVADFALADEFESSFDTDSID